MKNNIGDKNRMLKKTKSNSRTIEGTMACVPIAHINHNNHMLFNKNVTILEFMAFEIEIYISFHSYVIYVSSEVLPGGTTSIYSGKMGMSQKFILIIGTIIGIRVQIEFVCVHALNSYA